MLQNRLKTVDFDIQDLGVFWRVPIVFLSAVWFDVIMVVMDILYESNWIGMANFDGGVSPPPGPPIINETLIVVSTENGGNPFDSATRCTDGNVPSMLTVKNALSGITSQLQNIDSVTFDLDITPSEYGRTVFLFEHTLNSRFLVVKVFDVLSSKEVHAAVYFPDVGMLSVGFGDPPGLGRKFKIIVACYFNND